MRASCCHDRHRSSNGWAASGRKATGVPVALSRLFRAGLAEVSGRQVRLRGGVGIDGLLDRADGGLGGQTKGRLDVRIHQLLQFVAPVQALLEGGTGHMVGRAVADAQGRLKYRRLLGRR